MVGASVATKPIIGATSPMRERTAAGIGSGRPEFRFSSAV